MQVFSSLLLFLPLHVPILYFLESLASSLLWENLYSNVCIVDVVILTGMFMCGNFLWSKVRGYKKVAVLTQHASSQANKYSTKDRATHSSSSYYYYKSLHHITFQTLRPCRLVFLPSQERTQRLKQQQEGNIWLECQKAPSKSTLCIQILLGLAYEKRFKSNCCPPKSPTTSSHSLGLNKY